MIDYDQTTSPSFMIDEGDYNSSTSSRFEYNENKTIVFSMNFNISFGAEIWALSSEHTDGN